MSKLDCAAGDIVAGGTKLGEIGRGQDDIYVAHLHVDCRFARYTNPSMRSEGSEAWIKKNYFSPERLY